MPAPSGPSAEDEVVDLCRDLIRIDTSNYGDGSGPGERAAAEYVAGKLAEVGLEPEIFESEPTGGPAWSSGGRARTPAAPALLVHGHLDVVPAAGRRTGSTTRSPARSPTAASGAAARST